MSSPARITSRRRMKRGSSPASTIFAQPVERGVGVRAAHALDEGADGVVVLVAVAVVAQGAGAGCSARPPQADAHHAVGRSGGVVATASSSALSAVRASPPATRTRCPIASSVDLGAGRAAGRAPRRRARGAGCGATSASSSGLSWKTRLRESSGALTSKKGFSVVAPIRMTVPSSTCGSSASCCALLKRWISSTRRIVRWFATWRRRCALGDDLADVGDARHHRVDRLEVRLACRGR